MEKKKIEILAPAGSFDSLKAAVAAGADAVYMGGARFGARAYAENSDETGMLEAIRYVHLHGCRLYMTVNTLFKEDELGELYSYLLPFYEEGLDGVIVQDLGALRFMREHFPGMELHASTQMTITSLYGAKMLKELGCCRVVPARELSLEEISRIHKEADVEIESFVHGALCYCYSGQCLMSSLIGGRSGNRGRCAQPCRLPYQVSETARDGKGTALNKDSQRFVLSLKDLCTLDILPELIEAGVYSLKIEGRMKSPRYTAGVVRIYRKYADRYLQGGKEGYYVEPADKKELLDLFDRGGFTSGYYTRHNGPDMIALKEKPEFREGNQSLFDYLDKTYVEKELKKFAAGHAKLEEGKPARFRLSCDDISVTVEGACPEAAKSQPMTADKVKKQLNKTGGTPFVFDELTVEVTGSLFLPVQNLNELRRDGLEALEEALLAKWRRIEMTAPSGNQPSKAPLAAASPVLSVSLEEARQLSPVLSRREVSRIYLDADGFSPETWQEAVARCHNGKKQCWLMLPHIFRTEAMDFFGKNRKYLEQSGFDGLLIRALEQVQWLKEQSISIPYGLDASVYAWNSSSVHSLNLYSPSFLTMPWELNSRELEPVAAACEKEQLPWELIVYGHAPMMVSAQCVTKTVKGCTHTGGVLYMKDRTGARLPVKNHCNFCYNTIYNPLPLSLLGSESSIWRMGAGSVRLAFTIEEEGKEEAVLDAFIQAFLKGEPVSPPFKDFTRGHFKRGVE